ncbi:RDD family protein [Marinobacter hydrocarbonoclasticus]|nr:RDD family protein [Marinobacter nauticus]
MTTRDDPRDIITPDAFQIHPYLLNRPLASPWRRGIAMLIDLLVVAMITESGGVIFVLLVLATWRMRKRQWQAGRWALYGLYFLLAASVLSPAIVWFTSLGEPFREPVSQQTQASLEEVAPVISGSMALVKAELCDDAACVTQQLDGLAELTSVMNARERREIVAELVDNVPADERAGLQLALEQVLTPAPAEVPEVVTADNAAEPGEPDPVAELEAQLAREKARRKALAKEVAQLEETGTSPLAWLMGAVKDMGLGFGLAAFYFTVFVAWFDGQTVGKKLTRCRVRQLDGTPISVWDAFGRYGGYGAGITTGLLGFAQIFWDPNRQAIQDKISATVVEDLRPKARLNARRVVKGQVNDAPA